MNGLIHARARHILAMVMLIGLTAAAVPAQEQNRVAPHATTARWAGRMAKPVVSCD